MISDFCPKTYSVIINTHGLSLHFKKSLKKKLKKLENLNPGSKKKRWLLNDELIEIVLVQYLRCPPDSTN